METRTKYKKKGHLAWHCPPKYGKQVFRPKQTRFRRGNKKPEKPEKPDHVTEFVGRAGNISHKVYNNQNNYHHPFSDQKYR